MKKSIVSVVRLACAALCAFFVILQMGERLPLAENTVTAYAASEIKSISTKEELKAMASDASASYRLDADIDMEGEEWIPFKFGGKLDGNGHAVLNLTYKVTGDTSSVSYDGNYKKYDTYFGGMFSIVEEGAEISNLKLINIKASVRSDVPTFIGSVAGFLDGGTISGCEISGRLSIISTAKMFGAGGIAGYGRGLIKDTDSEMTLICIDEDVQNRDEQFLGGAYATGYIDMDNCNVTVYGYDSDHGYVHNGGLTGMYMFYPYGTAYSGSIKNCNVDGFIKFFEDNTDRRAYCKAYWGELLSTNVVIEGCTETFKSEEVFDYSKILLPDTCDTILSGLDELSERYSKTVTESTDTKHGYTTYKCNTCGYEYKDRYTLLLSDLKKAQEKYEMLSGEFSPTASDNASKAQNDDWTESQDNTSGVVILFAAFAVIILASVSAGFFYVKKNKRISKKYKKHKKYNK